MKVCERCGDEIFTRDGDNVCDKCERKPMRRVRATRKAREQMLRDLGLTKVKGSLGGTYWE